MVGSKFFIFGGDSRKDGNRKNGDEVGREPVGLAQSGEDAILDVLDPELFIDTQVFKDGVEGDQNSGAENGVENELDFGGLDVGDKGRVKDDIGNGTHQAAMKTGVITPKTSVGVNGKDSRENLRKEKKQDGEIEGGASDGDLFLVDPPHHPGGGNENGQDVDQEHFVKLEDLGGTWPEYQGNEEKKGVEEKFNGFFGVVG